MTQYHYFRLPKKGVIVAAIDRIVDGQDETLEYHVGLSFCSPKDHFVKAKGRLISHGRMKKHPLVVEPSALFNATSSVEAGAWAFNHLVPANDRPSWCRRETMVVEHRETSAIEH